jgi:hypothetical protein
MFPSYVLKILFNITLHVACIVLMINHQSFQKYVWTLPRPAHGRFIPDPFLIIAPFHAECCYVATICREVTHTKAYGGAELWLQSVLTWARYRGEWSASRPGQCIPGKQPRFSLYRRLGGPQSRSGRFGIERNLLPGFAPQSVPSLYVLSYPAFR